MPDTNRHPLTVEIEDNTSTASTSGTPVSAGNLSPASSPAQSNTPSPKIEKAVEADENTEIQVKLPNTNEHAIREKIYNTLRNGTNEEIISLLNECSNGNEKYVLNLLANSQILEIGRHKIDLLAKILLNQNFAQQYVTGAVLDEFETYLHSDRGMMQLHLSTFQAILYSPFINKFSDTQRWCEEEGIPYVPELIKLYKRNYQKDFPDAPIARLIQMKESSFYIARINAFNELVIILDENEKLEECKTTFEEIATHLMISGIDAATTKLLELKLTRHPQLLAEIKANLTQLIELETALPHRNNESFSKWLMLCALAGFTFAKEKLNAKTEALELTNAVVCQMLADNECTHDNVSQIFSPECLGELRALSLSKPITDPLMPAVLQEFKDSNYDIQAITDLYGVDGRNRILTLTFAENQTMFHWPQNEAYVAETMICQLLLNNKINVKDVLTHGSTLINHCNNVTNRKYFNTVLKNNMTLDLNKSLALPNSHQVLFPLANSGIVSLDEIMNCSPDSIKFIVYRDFAITTNFEDTATPKLDELADIQKLFLSKIFHKIQKDFLNPLETEIEKLKLGADKAELEQFLAFKKRITKIILGLKDCKDHSIKTLRLNLVKVTSQFFLDQGKHCKPVQRIIENFIKNNCDIAAVTKQYGVDSRNNLLHFYFNQHENKFTWPRAQQDVKNNFICQLILNGKMTLQEVLAANKEDINKLIPLTCDDFVGELIFSGKLPVKTALAASSKNLNKLSHPAIETYLSELISYERKLRFDRIFSCASSRLHLFPLIDNNVLSVEDLAAMPTESLEYQILTSMTDVRPSTETTQINSHSATVVRNDSLSSANSANSQPSVNSDPNNPEWSSGLYVARLRKTVAYFKSEEFMFIKRKVLIPICEEIARLQNAKGGVFTENGNFKMIQMQTALQTINAGIQKQFRESLMPASAQNNHQINTDTKVFTQGLYHTVFALVKSLANQPSINNERNIISKFFRALLRNLSWFTKPFVRDYDSNNLFKPATVKKVKAIEAELNTKRLQLA